MLNGKKIVVVLPAYNAALTLRRTFEDLPLDLVDDVILTDDASRDNTSDVARELGIHTLRHDRNRGYGGNQKTCYRAALDRGADVVIMVHPDYQYTPRLATAMAAMLAYGEFDGVMASRILGTGALKGGMPLYKYVANRFLTAAENILLGQKLSEYHTGYRAWTRDLLERLPLESCSDDFVFDNQMIVQACSSASTLVRSAALPNTSQKPHPSTSGVAASMGSASWVLPGPIEPTRWARQSRVPTRP